MTDNKAKQNSAPKSYLVSVGGRTEVWDEATYTELKDALYNKYPDANMFEMDNMTDFSAVDDKMQYVVNTGDRTETWDAATMKELGSALKKKYPDATVQSLKYKDYWYDKALADEESLKTMQGELESLNKELGGKQRWSPEYNAIEAQISDKRGQMAKIKSDYDANPRVVAYNEEMAAAQAEAEKRLPVELRNQTESALGEIHAIGMGFKEPFEYDEKTEPIIEGVGEDGKLIIDKEQFQKNLGNVKKNTTVTQSMYAERTAQFAGEYSDYKAASTFLDAYDYLKNNKSSVAQGAWYNLNESASQFANEQVHDVLAKLESKCGNLNEVTPEDIDNNLSQSEKVLLQSYFLAMGEEAKVSKAFRGGEIAGESFKIAAEMIVYDLALNALLPGAGTAAGAGSKAARISSAIAKWYNSGSKLTKLGKGVAKLTGATAKLGLKATGFTALAPTTYSHIAKKKLTIGDDGKLKDSDEDIMRYFAEDVVENFTELSGEGVLKLFGKAGDLAKGTRLGAKIADRMGSSWFGKAGKWLATNSGTKWLKRAGFHGLPVEVFEEFEGAVINQFTGLDENAISNFADKDNLTTMMIGFAPMTLLGMGSGIGTYAYASHSVNKNAKNLRNVLLNNGYKDEQIDYLLNYERQMSPESLGKELNNVLATMKANGSSKESMKAVTDYAVAVGRYKAMEGSFDEIQLKLKNKKLNELGSKYGTFYQTTDEGSKKQEQNVTTAVLNDGRGVFLTSEKNENGEYDAIDVETGDNVSVSDADIAIAKDEQGNNVGLVSTRSLDTYLTELIMDERRNTLSDYEAAYNNGQEMTAADLSSIREQEQQAEQNLLNTGITSRTNSFTEDSLNLSSSELLSLSEQEEFTEDESNAIRELAIAKRTNEGLVDKLKQPIISSIDSHNSIANGASNNGMVTVGTHNGKTVYVKGGVQTSNGSIVKPDNAKGYPVEVVDAATGEVSVVDSKEVTNAGNINTATWNRSYEVGMIKAFEQKIEELRNAKSPNAILSEVYELVGKKVYLNINDNIILVEVDQILPSMEVLIKGKKGDLGGKSVLAVGIDEFYNMIYRDANGNPVLPKEEQGESEVTDYRGETVSILVNGVPTSVEVMSQDNSSDSIVYEYTDENGNIRRGRSTISGFEQAIKQANEYVPEQPNVPEETPVAETSEQPIEEAPSEEVATEEPVEAPVENMPLDPESINWDELFEQDKEAYFIEMQNQFGEEAVDILNEEINAAQGELDALGKAKTKSQNDRIKNRNKKKALQSRIDALNEMVARLTTPAEAPVVEEVTATVEEAPVAQETEATVEAPAETAPVTPEQPSAPVADTPAEPAAEPAAPVAPKHVADAVEAAKNREKRLLELVERNGVSDAFKRDRAYEAGKDVGDFFATYEEYEDYQADATDFGEYNENFERGVKESFANRQSNERHIGEAGLEVSSEAQALALDAVLTALDESNIETERLNDEQTEQYLKQIGADTETQFSIDTDKPIFLSNAAIAVMGIKQEKATPEQWLKMIEKSGGLKAGEDKWMGLSDWLKSQDAKTLTKQEVLDFINENTIRIEEVNYKHWEDLDYIDEATKILEAEMREIGWDAMVEKYPRFDSLFEEYNGELMWSETRASIADYEQFIFDENNLLERPINDTRADYTTNGLDNKKEIAIIVPTIESWNKSDVIHFGDAGDGRAVAWIRFGETKKLLGTTEVEGKKKFNWARVLVIDEIQSKRHQEGREKGYAVSIEEYAAALEDFQNFNRAMREKYGANSLPADWSDEDQAEFNRLRDRHSKTSKSFERGIPDAPFEKNWHELAMKRMLRYAAENGYDVVAWTKGEQQADRYNLGKIYNEIEREDNANIEGRTFSFSGGNYDKVTVNEDGVVVDSTIEEAKGKPLSDLVGKDLAVKMMSLENYDTIDGEELRIGGEGMKGFYDKMLPAFMNKYGKKWGVKVSDITLLNVEESGRVMHSVPVNEAMKESVMEGQPMFYKTPNGTVYGWTDGKKIYLTKAGFNPNTPIHEYTHLWSKAMMQKNPKGWNSVKSLLKGTPIWDEVINDPNYSDIKNNEDAVASEALSRLSGSKNAAKMEQMAQQMIDEAKGTMRKAEARGLIQNMKDALAKFWNWVGTNLFKIDKFDSVEQVTDRVLWDLLNNTDLQLDTLSESQVETQIVTDPKVIAELEASPKTKGFRNVVQNENGTFSSPMAYWLQSTTEGAKSRIETAKFELGKWEEAEEHPELVDGSGHVTLVKPNKKTVSPVAYDPYIHNRLEPVNLQFKEAWKRSDLVYVETEVANTDLESGYHADKAKLPVGIHSWSNGAVMLSKYDKPVRVMPWDEVADAWAKRLNGKGVEFDVVPAEMRPLLVERGIEILPPHKNAGKDCNDAYTKWKGENEKIAINRNAEPSQSDIPSGDVASNSKGAPTVIKPRQQETDANISNSTQKAKSNIKKLRYAERTPHNISEESDGLLFRSADSPITPEMDADYLAAVERGDMDTAQRMVLEAAKLAMPNTKVVDENDNPLVLYHGSPSSFTVFDIQNFGKTSDTGSQGKGFYFTSSQEYADRYRNGNEQGMNIGVFLNLEKPLVMDDSIDSQIKAFVLGSTSVQEVYERIDAMVETNNASRSDAEEIKSLISQELIDLANEQYDGVIPINFFGTANEFVALHPNQIKSADPVTYDDNGNVIPLSERFNPKNDDIRFRKGENNTKFVEQFEFKQNNEREELEYSDEFRRLQEESARMSGQLVSEKDGVQQAAIRGLVGRIGGIVRKELDRARSGRRYKLRTVVNDSKGTSFEIIENVDGRLFHDIFEIVRTYLPNGELVDLHDNYDDAICYITSDGLAGFAVSVEGNLISVYSLYGKTKRGFLGSIKDLVTEAGATHLDGYNSKIQPLAKIYSDTFGWKVASMMDYNMEYDHDNIAENHGMPQVAFMVNTEAEIETKHFDKDQYDEAVAYQLEQVETSQRVDAQNAAIDYLAGDARAAAIEHAVNKEASKLGVAVTYKTRSEMPKGHQNDKGYYNTKTGEIVICTDNNASIADAIQTILHEAVAHKGLRQLMGDRFNEFISRVYNSLDAETKANVDALAEKHYNGDKMVAMEEYMASLAENENFAETSVWEKIKSIFENIINSILGRNDIQIGDKELRYILRASYNNMVNPNTMNTIEGWSKDTNMRNELGINEAAPEIMSRTGIDPDAVSQETARQVYDRVVSEGWQEFQRQFQDAYQPVRIAIEAIQQETGNIPVEDYENYLLIQNQTSSRSRVEIDNFQRKYYEPIVEQVNKIIDMILEARGMKNNKKNRAEVYAEVRQYMIAKHGLERNEYYRSTKGEDRDYAGLTSLFGFDPTEYEQAEEEAARVIEKFEKELGRTENQESQDINDLWKRINAATDKTLRHSYESGMISRQQYDQIRSMFNFYIPLRGFDETTAEDVYSYARFEGNRFNAAVHKAEGRTSVANDPIATIMNMAESEIAQGNKNRAKQALYNFILNRPVLGENGMQKQNSLMQVEDVWYVKTVDSEGHEAYMIAAPDHAAGETYSEFEQRMASLEAEEKAFKSKKGQVDVGMRFQKQRNQNAHYIYLKINGVDKAIYINGDPKAADAVNGTYQQKRQFGEDRFRQINRLISSTFTNYSLEFTARNFFRDMSYSHINMGIKEKDTAYRKTFRKNWRSNNMGTMLKMLKAYRAGEYDNKELNAIESAFVEFMENGGQTGYTLINSVESHKKELEKSLERMRKGSRKGGLKNSTVFKYTLGGIELLNEASELITRFAAFKTSRDMGRSVVESVNDAKEITVNFNTKGAQDGTGWMGAVARYFGWSKYFFNASVQGVQNLKAMANANKLKFCGVVGGMMGLGFLMSVLTSAIASMFGGDDDEYWNIPEYDRQNNLCICIGGGDYIKIPLPIGFREIYAMGDMTAALAFDKKFSRDIGSVGMDYANKIASMILPINPLEGRANGLGFWNTFLSTALPSSFQFAIQNATNTDWKGAPLQKEYTWNEDDPQWMKAFNNAPDWMVGLSKWCNENINLDGDYRGIDWSPEKLDNTLSNLFGGVYTLIKKTGNSISAAWNEEERNLSNIPLAGVVFGTGIESDGRFVTDAYFDMREYYDANVNSIKRVASNFGLSLEDIFVKQKGAHHPKIQEIYGNKNFEWMKDWYLGHEGNRKASSKAEKLGLRKLNQDIKDLQKSIAEREERGMSTEKKQEKLIEKQKMFDEYYRDFTYRLLEMD